MKKYSVKSINNQLADETGNVTLPTGSGLPSLPVPQIAKRIIMLGENPIPNPKVTEPQYGWRHEIDGISPRRYNVDDLIIVDYPDGYYKEQFDIYFNSFGDREWLNLPDKRLELCMVRNSKKRRKTAPWSTITPLDESYKGNKKRYTNAIVHPPNVNAENFKISNTIYSGGENNSLNPWYVFPTEWRLNELDSNFSEDGVIQTGLNRLNNPNITVELDVRDYFRESGVTGISYPHNMFTDVIVVKALGKITQTTINRIYDPVLEEFSEGEPAFHRRNPTLFFRLSAGDPNTAKYGSSARYYFNTADLDLFAVENDIIYIDLGYGNEYGNYPVDSSPFSSQFQLIIQTYFPGQYRCNFNKAGGIILEKIVDTNNPYEPVPFVPTIQNISNDEYLSPTQLRPADPATFYQKRIFSDLSQPIKIKLKIDNFFVDYNNPTLGYTPFTYGHKTTIG